MLVAHRTITPCTVSIDTNTKVIDLNKVSTIQKYGDDLVINNHTELNDLMEDCQNRESSKQASYKRLGKKNSALYQEKMATRTRNAKTQSIRQQFTIQRPEKVQVGNSTSMRFQCNRCQKLFKQKSYLRDHLVFVHNKSTEHQCMKCDKYLPSAGRLKEHMLYHEGTRNYQCENCEKRFYNKSHLQDHMRIHTGDRPFMCKSCGQKFARKDTLKIHMRIHTGERPYACEMCGKQFSQLIHLKKHRQSHIIIKP